MNISIIVNPVLGGWSPWDIRVGGTEESVIEWASGLTERGHVVEVYHNGRHGLHRGVDYIAGPEYANRARRGVTLNVNYPDLPVDGPTVYFNNLVDARKYDLSKFEAIIHPSHWAKDNLGVNHPNQLVVPHGYDPTEIYPGEKVPRTVLYASSPDRGLSELVRVWPDVVNAVPDAQLIVSYNGHIDAPNTLCLGNVSSSEMAELYRTSDIWCHPALGGELFGITAIKAQVAGCWPVYYPTMALTETVKFGLQSSPDSLAHDLIETLKQGHPTPRPPHYFADWKESTHQLEIVLIKYA